MAVIATPELAVAVSKAGALGMLGGGALSVEVLGPTLDRMRAETSAPIGVNFIARFLEPAQVETAAKRARVVELFYGNPDASLVEQIHRGGALASWQVGSVEKAVAAQTAGCDFVVAQGIEAGGHVRGTIGLLALLSQVLEVVDIPVVAAGGIGTGRTMAPALAAGASAVRIGTRFVAADEAGAHPEYAKRLIGAEAGDTVYTSAFSVGWPDAPHRVLRSSLEAAERFVGDVVGERAWPDDPNTWVPVPRFYPIAVSKLTRGEIGAMPMWAGESVSGVKRVQPAAEIVGELSSEAEELLRVW